MTHCSISFWSLSSAPLHPSISLGPALLSPEPVHLVRIPSILETYGWKGIQGHLIGKEKRKHSRIRQETRFQG